MKVDYRTKIDPVIICDCGSEPDFNMSVESDGKIFIHFYCRQCLYHCGYEGMHVNEMVEIFKYEY